MKNKEEKITKKLYSDYAKKEWKRLVKDPAHRLEIDTTMKFLEKYLPKKGLILDAGGGPGRYSIELAKKGYDLILLDLTPENLELAKKKIRKEGVQGKVKEVVEGSIVDLSRFTSNSFDAVICLGGPLSHVHPEKNRQKALAELFRVAKKNAPVFVSVMGKFGTLMNYFRWPGETEMPKHWNDFYQRGDDYMWHGGKGFCHFFTRNELEKLFSKNKLLEVVGLEGISSPAQKEFNKFGKLYKKGYKNWMKMHYEICTDPWVVNASLHMLAIGRKK